MPREDTEFNDLVEKNVDEMSTIINAIDAEVASILALAVTKKVTISSRAKTINEINLIVVEGKSKIDDLLIEIMPESYKKGIADANNALPNVLSSKALSPAHAAQINVLLADASADFGIGLEGVSKKAGQTLGRVASEQIRLRITEGVIDGASIPKISKSVLEELRKQGFVSFTSRNGRNMKLTKYSEMLTRTHIMRAANEGTLTRGMELGHTIFEMSKHGGVEDDACLSAERQQFFDTTGKKYPVPPQMPIHPNCRHKLFLRPDLS